jgi:hypothetical protein
MNQPELVFGPPEQAVRSPATFEKAAAAGASRPEPELAMSYCPRCSARLAARSCKLICPGCGYYMSCSDFY